MFSPTVRGRAHPGFPRPTPTALILFSAVAFGGAALAQTPPRVAEVEIFPLLPIDADRLWPALRIRAGDDFDPDAEIATIRALREEARRAGVVDAAVSSHRLQLTSSTLALRFYIEGLTPAVLRKATFPGAGWLNAATVRQFLKKLEPASFDKGSTVTASLLRTVEQESTTLLRARGYVQARARLEETRPTPRGLEVTLRIERGPRFRIATGRVHGVRFPDPEDWKPATDRFIDKTITARRVRELNGAIRQRAMAEGFMASSIEMDFTVRPEERKVVIDAAIDEGTTSTLGAVRIEREPPKRGYGNSWYHRTVAPPLGPEIVRRQIRARMGAPLNQAVLDDALRRLWRLGAFDSVEMETAATSSTLVRDLVAKVRDRRTATFGASVGWSDEIGPITRWTFSESNLGGRGDGLSLGLSLARDSIGGEIAYLDRYWRTGERWFGPEREPSLLWSAHLGDRNFDEYAEGRAGGDLQLSYLIGASPGLWSNVWKAGVEKISYDPYGDADEYEEDFDDYPAATIEYRLMRDTLDRDEWESTRGTRFSTSLEAGVADGLLLKWTTRGEWRHPLSRRFTWITQGEFGVMPVDATDVGLTHRYHAGGAEGVRGFRYRGLGPVDPFEEDLHIGGATIMTLRNEVRFRLNDSIQFPLFFDIGTLDEDPFGVGGPRASAGIGIRYLFPDSDKEAYFYLSKNVLKEETDNDLSIRFGFSYAFGPRPRKESL